MLLVKVAGVVADDTFPRAAPRGGRRRVGAFGPAEAILRGSGPLEDTSAVHRGLDVGAVAAQHHHVLEQLRLVEHRHAGASVLYQGVGLQLVTCASRAVDIGLARILDDAYAVCLADAEIDISVGRKLAATYSVRVFGFILSVNPLRYRWIGLQVDLIILCFSSLQRGICIPSIRGEGHAADVRHIPHDVHVYVAFKGNGPSGVVEGIKGQARLPISRYVAEGQFGPVGGKHEVGIHPQTIGVAPGGRDSPPGEGFTIEVHSLEPLGSHLVLQERENPDSPLVRAVHNGHRLRLVSAGDELILGRGGNHALLGRSRGVHKGRIQPVVEFMRHIVFPLLPPDGQNRSDLVDVAGLQIRGQLDVPLAAIAIQGRLGPEEQRRAVLTGNAVG